MMWSYMVKLPWCAWVSATIRPLFVLLILIDRNSLVFKTTVALETSLVDNFTPSRLSGYSPGWKITRFELSRFQLNFRFYLVTCLVGQIPKTLQKFEFSEVCWSSWSVWYLIRKLSTIFHIFIIFFCIYLGRFILISPTLVFHFICCDFCSCRIM